MKPQKLNTLGPLILIFNLVFTICLLSFGYLLFGEYIVAWTKKPVLVERQLGRMAPAADDYDRVVNGIHLQSGLVYAKGFDVVRGTCTACHSAKLVTQNRATREGWEEMIRWMQKTQGLWDLGETEPIILDYLAEHYAPEEISRRANLDLESVEWFILNLEDN